MVNNILNKSNLEDENSFSMFGTNSFNLVWQKVCEEVMDNKLHTKLKDLGLSNLSIPKDARYTADTVNGIKVPLMNGQNYSKNFLLAVSDSHFLTNLYAILIFR